MNVINFIKKAFFKNTFAHLQRNSELGDFSPNKFRFPNIQNKNFSLILVVGAESSGTRFIADFISEHPKVLGKLDNQSHHDYFDNIWNEIQRGSNEEIIKQKFPILDDKVLLTRRSIPHSSEPGKPAEPFEFPLISKFIKIAENKGHKICAIITVRSYIANILSWSQNRASAKGSLRSSFVQYQRVYPYLFNELIGTNTTYLILPIEAIIIDGKKAMKAIYSSLGLEPYSPKLFVKKNINIKYYSLLSEITEQEPFVC